jgi:prophage antirepressor-like protein
MENKNAIVVFETVPIKRAWHDKEQWLSALDVAKALGYDNPSRAVSDMMKNNQDLFKGYEKFVSLESAGGRQKARMLNLKGVIAFCIKSNMPKALPFQRWAVETLEKHIKNIPSEVRLIASTKRVRFTDELKEHGVNKPHEYINITRSMKEKLDIDKNKPKAECDLIEVMKIAAAEEIARINIAIKNPDGYRETKPLCDKASEAVKIGTSETEKLEAGNE